MRIGMVCPYSLSVWGGVQAQVLGLSGSLRAQGVDVQILAPCDGQPPVSWVTPLGDSVPYAENGSMAPLAPDPAAQLRMIAALRDDRFDLLHLHEPFVPGPTLTAVLMETLPMVGTFHVSGEVRGYRWFRMVAAHFAKRIGHKVAVSSEAAGMAQRYLGGQYETLFNGVDCAKIDSVPSYEKEHCPVVFFVGRHEPRKGLRTLLQACEKLPVDVKVWIAGVGPETAALKRAFSGDSRLEWLGALSEEEKIARLKAADVFCVPSLGGESFGIVLLEGMAAGTPVIASDLPAYRSVSSDGQGATLFSTGDADSLAKAILEVFHGGVVVEDRISYGRERANMFSMKRLSNIYLSRYRELLERSG